MQTVLNTRDRVSTFFYLADPLHCMKFVHKISFKQRFDLEFETTKASALWVDSSTFRRGGLFWLELLSATVEFFIREEETQSNPVSESKQGGVSWQCGQIQYHTTSFLLLICQFEPWWQFWFLIFNNLIILSWLQQFVKHDTHIY